MVFTLRDAIDRTLARISLAGGVDVQTYAEEPLVEIINHKINTLFDYIWWSQFMDSKTFTLDGSLGIVTDDLSSKIKRWADIKNVWYNDEQNALPRLPSGVNPRTIRRRCIGPYNDVSKVFRVYPANTTGLVTIEYRTKPNPVSNEDDVILFDDELIISGTAYDYVNGLGLNPGEEDKFLSMYDARLKQLVPLENQHGTELGYSTTTINNSWQEMN